MLLALKITYTEDIQIPIEATERNIRILKIKESMSINK